MGQFCLNGSFCPILLCTLSKKGKEKKRKDQTNAVSRFGGCIWATVSISRSYQSKCLRGTVQILLGPERLTRIVFHMVFWEREAPYSRCSFLLSWYNSGSHSPTINHHPQLSLLSSSLLFPLHSASLCSLQGWRGDENTEASSSPVSHSIQ